MIKLILTTLILIPSFAQAAKYVALKVTDIKTNKVKTEIQMPMWASEVISSLGTMSEQDNVDLKKLILAIKNHKKTGDFLTILDHEDGQKVTFSLQ